MAVIMAVDDREVSITVNYVITNRFPVLQQYFASPGDFFALDWEEVARSYQEYFPALPDRGGKKTCCFPNNFWLIFHHC
jgi:hypothetical protein